MTNSKQWWKSKGVWTGVVTFLIGAYALATPLVSQFGVTLPAIPEGILVFLGAIGVYARTTANTTIIK